MTKFSFRLDGALRIRRLRVEAERAKLQTMLAQRTRWEKSRLALLAEREQAAEFVRQSPVTGAVDLRALSSFTLGLEAHARSIREAIAGIDQKIAGQRARLGQEETAQRQLEKLREKSLAEWNLQLEREIEGLAQELWLYSHTSKTDNCECSRDPQYQNGVARS